MKMYWIAASRKSNQNIKNAIITEQYSIHKLLQNLDILVEETGPGVDLRNVQICAKFRCPTLLC